MSQKKKDLDNLNIDYNNQDDSLDIPSLNEKDQKTMELLKNMPSALADNDYKENLKSNLIQKHAKKRAQKKKKMAAVISAAAACLIIVVFSFSLWEDIFEDDSPAGFIAETEEKTEEREEKPDLNRASLDEDIDDDIGDDKIETEIEEVEEAEEYEIPEDKAVEIAGNFGFSDQDVVETTIEKISFKSDHEELTVFKARGELEYYKLKEPEIKASRSTEISKEQLFEKTEEFLVKKGFELVDDNYYFEKDQKNEDLFYVQGYTLLNETKDKTMVSTPAVEVLLDGEATVFEFWINLEKYYKGE